MAASLSVLIPALNEAAHIEATIRGVIQAVDAFGLEAEILVLSCVDENGGSDGTVDIVRALAATDGRVRSVHAAAHQRLAEKFRQGAMLASKAYVVMVPGDNQNTPLSLARTFARIGEADVILGYPENPEVRPAHRRILSRAYTLVLNLLFGQRLRYYHGINVYRTADLRQVLPYTESLALFAEVVLRLLGAGRTYVEVPVALQARPERSTLLSCRNARQLAVDICKLRLHPRPPAAGARQRP